ncbi:MAG: 50S ribosomal protein L18 [Bacteroidales bacterium]|nr:50S ribosomal protein L18 [Bacteroidales bacterium]
MAITKIERRERIKKRIRKVVNGTAERPRMSVFRSNKQISVQVIDDVAGVTIAAASSLDKEIAAQAKGKTKIEQAALVGEAIAKKVSEKGISSIVFDRNGYLYHGRVKSLADSARSNGLNF